MKNVLPLWSRSDELGELIAVLNATEQRITELTIGEVDTVADAQGHTYLLRSAQDSIRLCEAARQAAILDALPAQIALLDRQGELVSANAAWHASVIAEKGQRPALRLNGVEYPDEGVKGATSVTAARLTDGIRSVLDGTVLNFSTEYQEDSAAGTAWYLFTVTPLAGEPVSGAVVMHMDITARKQASQQLVQSEQRLALATDSAGAGIWELDLAAKSLYWDTRMYGLYGIDPQDFSGASGAWQNSVLAQDRERAEAQLAQAIEGNQDFHTEFRIRWPNGEIRFIEAHARVIRAPDGTPTRIIGVNLDITERKLAEQQLEHSLRELKSRNIELNDFAFIASHDLQEPLRKLRMLADRIEHNNAAQLDAKGRDYLARMAAAAQRMQTLVNDLLSYSTALRSTSSFAEVDLNLVLAAVLVDFDEHLRESTGQIELGPMPETVWGDASQLRQLFQNLLGNALKYRHKDRVPRVQVLAHTAVLADGSSVWRIEVTDNGIGFDPAQCDRIFAPFQRLHGRDEYTGTGIGLTIVRRIAERHGGSVQAQSTQDEGATFEVLLPHRVTTQRQ